MILCIFNKPGLAQVGAISKAQKRGPFGLVRYCMLRGKPFWFSSLGQRVQFGVFLKFCITFGVELFWSLQVYRKTLTRSHDYSRLFSLEKRRLKCFSLDVWYYGTSLERKKIIPNMYVFIMFSFRKSFFRVSWVPLWVFFVSV